MAGMRRALTLAPGRMQIEDVPAPAPPEGHALLGVRSVGLCGSDYHLYRGTHPYAHFPQTQGHEFSAVVLDLPDGYHGRVRPGDIVAVEPLVACGRCRACSRGRYNCCTDLGVMGAHLPGALAEQVSAHPASLYPVGELDPDLAALVEPVSIGCHAVERGEVGPGDDVLVIGGGPIGLAVTLAARARGARVVLADRVPARLERALRTGAAATVLSGVDDLVTSAHDLTGGRGPDVVVDATGAPEMIRAAVDAVAHAGTVVVVGISMEQVALPVVQFTRKEITVRGSRNNVRRFPEAISLLNRHRETAQEWITHRVSLDELPDAIEFAIARPDVVEKMVVRISG